MVVIKCGYWLQTSCLTIVQNYDGLKNNYLWPVLEVVTAGISPPLVMFSYSRHLATSLHLILVAAFNNHVAMMSDIFDSFQKFWSHSGKKSPFRRMDSFNNHISWHTLSLSQKWSNPSHTVSKLTSSTTYNWNSRLYCGWSFLSLMSCQRLYASEYQCGKHGYEGAFYLMFSLLLVAYHWQH